MTSTTEARLYFGGKTNMSSPEKNFYDLGYLLVRESVAVKAILYEWMTFNLPGGKYTPDFFILYDDGIVAFVEVKQVAVSKSGKRYYAGQSYRDSRSKLRAAAELNPWFYFYMASYNRRDGWKIELITPSREIDYIRGLA